MKKKKINRSTIACKNHQGFKIEKKMLKYNVGRIYIFIYTWNMSNEPLRQYA